MGVNGLKVFTLDKIKNLIFFADSKNAHNYLCILNKEVKGQTQLKNNTQARAGI